MTPPPNDDELVDAYLQGDASAAEALVEAYWDRIYSYAYRLTLGKSDAEDIAQETFLRAFRNISNYKPEGQFKAWLLRIATNLVLDLRKSPRARDVVLDMSNQGPVKVGEGPESVLIERELVQALWQAVQELSKEQQIAMVLRTVERMDYTEIAQVLDVKESTARWHMYEARRILRQKLGRKFDLESTSRGREVELEAEAGGADE